MNDFASAILRDPGTVSWSSEFRVPKGLQEHSHQIGWFVYFVSPPTNHPLVSEDVLQLECRSTNLNTYNWVSVSGMKK